MLSGLRVQVMCRMSQTSATPSAADLHKNVEGKICIAFSITDTCTWVHHLAEPFTEADKKTLVSQRNL